MLNHREEIVARYFNAWIVKDASALQTFFTEDILYTNAYGQHYQGLDQVKRWFEDWNQQGNVTEWQIKQFIHQGAISVVEWHYQCAYHSTLSAFDGVSLIYFDDQDHIVELKEFHAKADSPSPQET